MVATTTNATHSPSRTLAIFSRVFVTSFCATGLFTPEEYASRQKEVQEQASAAAAAAEEQKDAVRREQSLELQVDFC